MGWRRPVGGFLSQKLLQCNSVHSPIAIWRGWKVECWKWGTQLKIILFFLLAAENKILTWSVLLKKGWIGSGYLHCANMNSEDVHIYSSTCNFTKRVWAHLSQQLNFNHRWNDSTLNECMESWLLNRSTPKILPLLTTWHIWKERNSAIFEGKQPSVTTVVFKDPWSTHQKILEIVIQRL
jgi:hypothetical protein